MKSVKPKRKATAYKPVSGAKAFEPQKSIKGKKPKAAPESKAKKPPGAPSLGVARGKAPNAGSGPKPGMLTLTRRRVIDPALIKDVRAFVDDPERWFGTPNMEFEGRAPIELLGTPEEARLRNRIEMTKYGLFS